MMIISAQLNSASWAQTQTNFMLFRQIPLNIKPKYVIFSEIKAKKKSVRLFNPKLLMQIQPIIN